MCYSARAGFVCSEYLLEEENELEEETAYTAFVTVARATLCTVEAAVLALCIFFPKCVVMFFR